jgi:hypothetical protein
MVSPAQGLLMMQGGTDRTGLASLLDSVGTPGADIIAQRRADAAEQEAMDEYERREAERLAELQALIDGEGGEEDSGFSFGSILDSGRDYLDSIFGGMVPENIQNMPAEDMATMDELAGIGSELKIDANRGLRNISTPKVPSTGVPKTGGVSLGVGKGPLSVFKRSPAALAISMVPTVAEAMGVDLPESEAIMEQANRPMFAYEGAENPIFDFDPSFGLSDKVKNLFGMADGGRVGMFGGGIMNNLLGSPQVQSMIQQYQQPSFDFSQVSSPSIPQPAVAPATPPQAYTPFVSTMPLYDPSTLGTGLPSTAGMADPYFVYDPYSPVGAFDAPPASIGPTPAGGFLTQKQIDETFKDMDKFTLAKQKEKADAAAKAKTQTKKGGGGEGKS